MHQVDEPAQLFDDLVALLCKLVRPDDLPALYAALTACTTKNNVRTCPSRSFSSYWLTQSESAAVSFVMSSIANFWFSSVPADPEPLGLDTCWKDPRYGAPRCSCKSMTRSSTVRSPSSQLHLQCWGAVGIGTQFRGLGSGRRTQTARGISPCCGQLGRRLRSVQLVHSPCT